MKFTLKGLIPLLAFLALGFALAVGLTKDPRDLPSQMIDHPFPDFSLTDLMEPETLLDQTMLRGQVSLVNVFGSWCVACDVEHPVLMKLSNEINIIGIDWRDDRTKAIKWLQRRGNPYDKIVFDPESVLAIDLGVTGAPESFLVDKSGNIRYKYVGPISADIWAKTFKPMISQLETEQ